MLESEQSALFFVGIASLMPFPINTLDFEDHSLLNEWLNNLG